MPMLITNAPGSWAATAIFLAPTQPTRLTEKTLTGNAYSKPSADQAISSITTTSRPSPASTMWERAPHHGSNSVLLNDQIQPLGYGSGSRPSPRLLPIFS